MDTKLKADIAESAVTTELLKRGCRVLRPVGDRMPYDLCVDIGSRLVRLQIKSAWYRKGVYIVDSRRTKTNRRRMIRRPYDVSDFDFAVIYLDKPHVFYVLPVRIFCSYKSEITLSDRVTSQRAPGSAAYREAWHLIGKSN